MDSTTPPEAQNGRTATPPGAPRALVVDDDLAIRTMLGDVLGGLFEVELAGDGQAALARLGEAPFDLLISDHMMPGLSGVDLLEQSLAIQPDLVRFLVTASRHAEDAVEAVNRARVDRFFIKPVRLAELRREALETVRQRRAERDLRARLATLSAIEDRQAALAPRVLLSSAAPDLLSELGHALETAGYALTLAASGATALDDLGARRFDVVVLDAALPDLPAQDVLRLARRLHGDLEVILLIEGDAVADLGDEVGTYESLRQPRSQPEVLPRLVHRAIERQALGRERERLLLDLVDTNRALRRTNEELRGVQADLRRKMAELDLLQDATVMSLTRLAEYRDMETGDHLERMRSYARIIAEALAGHPGFEAIDDAFVEAIYKAAPLHDIGKVGIPDRILGKPGPLTPEEWEVMRRHPTIGGQTLAEAERRAGPEGPTALLRMGKHIAWCHHERWDGAGYPRGLAGEDIPLEARIVTVADAYDAITSRRVYKPSRTHGDAVEALLEGRGRHFDPRVVDAFLGREVEILDIKARFAGDEVDLTDDDAQASVA